MGQNRVRAMEFSGDDKPDGDCYAPQIVLTSDSGYRWNTSELNTDSLPFTVERFTEAYNTFRGLDHADLRKLSAEARAVRWARAQGATDALHTSVHGHSQGDWGFSFVFSTPEWLEMTGAPGLSEADHTDLAAWVFGDVYEVYEDLEKDEDGDWILDGDDAPLTVYGMDEASKYGEITFPSHRTETYWED